MSFLPNKIILTAAGVIVAATVSVAGLALLNSGSRTVAAASATPTASAVATPSGKPAKIPHHAVFGRVVSTAANSLTVASSTGTTTTFTLGTHIKIKGPSGSETLAQLQPGEVLSITVRDAAQSNDTTSAPTVMAINDTGFTAA